jgi:hypothetical protein
MKKGRLFLCLATALVLTLSAIPAMATSYNFQTGYTNFNYSTLIMDSVLSITAKSSLGDYPANDPLFVTGYEGKVFWGELGAMDVAGMNVTFFGLGVHNSTGGGSAGISGEGGDADEALIFNFANPPGVEAASVKLTLVGLNTDGMNNDVIALYLEYTPLDNPSDVIIKPVSFTPASGTYVLEFNTLGVSGTFGQFAIRAAEGHFGVGGIEYTPNTSVPEPATLALFGVGLLGLGYLSRRRASKK